MARNTRSSALESRSARLKLPKRGKPYGSASIAACAGLPPDRDRRTMDRPPGDRQGRQLDQELRPRRRLRGEQRRQRAHLLRGAGDRSHHRTRRRGQRRSDHGERRDRSLRATISRPAAVASTTPALARLHLPPALLGKPVGLLTVRDLRSFRDGLLKGRTAGTVNRIISVLRAALELAAATDPRITNTAAFKVGLKKLPDAARARNVVLTDAQVRQLVALAYDESPEFGRLIETLADDGGSPVAGGAADGRRSAGRPRATADDAVVAQGQGRQADRPRAGADPGEPGDEAAAGGGRSSGRRAAAAQAGRLGLGRQRPARFRSAAWSRRPGSIHDVVTSYSLRHSSITRQLLRGVPIRVIAARPRHQRADDREVVHGHDRRPLRRAAPCRPARPGYTGRGQRGAVEGLKAHGTAKEVRTTGGAPPCPRMGVAGRGV